MNIIFNGAQINLIGRSQFELLSTDKTPFGFNVSVEYFATSPYENETLYNRTEVHFFYSDGVNDRHDMAFESDILYTGSTRPSSQIKSIIIVDATEKAQ